LENIWARISATLVTVIGIVTISDIIFDWRWGFDELLFKETQGAVLTPHLGRMAPFTAINFSFIGVSLLFLTYERQIKRSQFLCFFVLIISLMGMVGYLYGVKEFIGILPLFTSMAIHTSILFFILAVGIIFARPESGFASRMSEDDMGGTILRRLVPVIVMVLIFLGYLQTLWHNYNDLKYVTTISESSDVCVLLIAILVIFASVVFTVVIWQVADIVRTLDLEKKGYFGKLKIEKNKIENILQSIGDVVIVIDRSWNITLWNDAATALTGWTKDEVLGKPFRDYIKLIRESDRSENVRFIEEVMVTGKTQSLEGHTYLVKKDGKEIFVGDSAAPMLDEKKEVIGTIIIMRDMTKEREVSLVRSDFAYAAHQLRTPITIAMLMVETILDYDDIKKIKENLATAYRSLECIQKLSEELLEVSEIDQKTIVPTSEVIKLIDLFDGVIKTVEKKSLDHEVKILVPAISASSSIHTNAKLLKRALVEILDNAIIYSPKKSEVKIDIVFQEKSVLFEIQDFSLGIDSEHLPLIFTKFFRGSNYDANKIIGAGLGLYISKAYVQLLKGKIWFESEPGKGTIFYVSVPL
jgi:PAS domain S-box-containing protein